MTKRKARIYINSDFAGTLLEVADGYAFVYDDVYFLDAAKPAISLTLPKTSKEYRSKFLFPFFYGLLAEGESKQIQCRTLKLDERDHFTRLLKTAHTETIGAVTVREYRADQ